VQLIVLVRQCSSTLRFHRFPGTPLRNARGGWRSIEELLQRFRRKKAERGLRAEPMRRGLRLTLGYSNSFMTRLTPGPHASCPTYSPRRARKNTTRSCGDGQRTAISPNFRHKWSAMDPGPPSANAQIPLTHRPRFLRTTHNNEKPIAALVPAFVQLMDCAFATPVIR
jgi:hypothetical protein